MMMGGEETIIVVAVIKSHKTMTLNVCAALCVHAFHSSKL